MKISLANNFEPGPLYENQLHVLLSFTASDQQILINITFLQIHVSNVPICVPN